MAISNQIGFQQNYHFMQPYGCERFYTPTGSGSRVYTHIDRSIRVQEKPLGYIIGEFLLYAARKVDFTISRFIPSLPGARAFSTPSLSRNKNCCSEANSLRMENTVFRASARKWRKEVKAERNQTEQCRQENKDLDEQLRSSKKKRDQYRSYTITFSILTAISLFINSFLGFLLQRSNNKPNRENNTRKEYNEFLHELTDKKCCQIDQQEDSRISIETLPMETNRDVREYKTEEPIYHTIDISTPFVSERPISTSIVPH